DHTGLRTDIYAKRFDGTAWIDAGPGSADGTGASATTGRAYAPQLISGGSKLYLTWMDDSAAVGSPDRVALFVKAWNGTAFAETLAGDASNAGISFTGGRVDAFA